MSIGQRFLVTRQSGRRLDPVRIIGRARTEEEARGLYSHQRSVLRQGTVALVDTDASEVIAACCAPNLRTRW